MALVAEPETIVLHANLDPPLVVRTMGEGAMRHLEHVHGAAQHRHADWVSQTCATAKVLAQTQEAVDEGDHGTRHIRHPLGTALEVQLRNEAVVQPPVCQVVVVRVVAQPRHAVRPLALGLATHREVIPESAADLRVKRKLGLVLGPRQAVAAQLVHNESLREARCRALGLWHVLGTSDDLAIGRLELAHLVAPIGPADAFARPACRLVVLVAAPHARPTGMRGVLGKVTVGVAVVLHANASATVAVGAGHLSLVSIAQRTLRSALRWGALVPGL
mmetsp:Transcript_4317/g.13854  ORF Transcript_4317/g.13854 Transcript_4317/m.13854 type:complete len:275 (+) Transcript_4317:644-1468(+)